MSKKYLLSFVAMVVLSLVLVQCSASPSPEPPAPPSPGPGLNYVDYLSPPIIGSTVYDCGTAVVVKGYTVGAKVSVFANGNELLAEGMPYYWWWPFHLKRPLKEGDVLTAIQTVGTDSSFPSRDAVTAAPVPGYVLENKLPAPVVVPPLYDCQQVVPVNQVLEGSLSEVYGPSSDLIGRAETPFQSVSVGTSPLTKDQGVTARQYFCEKQYESPVSGVETVQARPSSVPPGIVYTDSLVPGATWVGVSGLVTGATVDVYADNQRVGGGIASGPKVAFAIDPPVAQGQKYRADQALCDVKSSSEAVEVKNTLGAVEIESPICEGSTRVTVLKAAENATVKLYVNQSQKGQGAGAEGNTTLALGDTVVLKAGDVISATQEIGAVVSPPPAATVTVSGPMSSPIAAVENGYPFFKLGAGTPATPGPLFLKGVLTTASYGPVFKAIMCGATQVQVEIVMPKDQGTETVTLVETSLGRFEGGWDWKHPGWTTPNDIPVGEYKARFQVTSSSGTAVAEQTFYVFDYYQDCVNRINELRALENLAPLLRNQSREACSDRDAKINHETAVPHTSQCGDAQNECPAYSVLSGVLDDCIKQQMYYDEKVCYQNNPSGCYGDEACQCGHYVNMTDTSFKSVACGLYVTSSGSVKSVQNFFR